MNVDNKFKINKFREKVTKNVNKFDPWYLIEMGAPYDEYDKYIDNVVSFVINEKPDLTLLEKRLYIIFETTEFDLATNLISSLASNIYNFYIEDFGN
ncbi:hypothetical protein KKG22_00675 [Patescibacteria group bacterium]|nr:hypothetical protein [Patescibacteria group bacterium]MBU1721924.1 hypothetical protein [Patescibacteria group bacterium]MBU1901217.1 hypothetical protein [Patescibacteria group bacterium]